jgi:hypothetical protein
MRTEAASKLLLEQARALTGYSVNPSAPSGRWMFAWKHRGTYTECDEVESKAPLAEFSVHDPIEHVEKRASGQSKGRILNRGLKIRRRIVEAGVRWKVARHRHAVGFLRTICRKRCAASPRLAARKVLISWGSKRTAPPNWR